jgi:hypothetical protein
MTCKGLLLCVLGLIASSSSGCAVPQFDVPVTSAGQPTVATIVARVKCELRDMVRDDITDVTTSHRRFLLNGDYVTAVSLSLEVNDTGGLSPNLSYMTPIGKAASFLFGAVGTLSEARDHTFTENIQLSLRKIYLDWKNGIHSQDCPAADTNLAGTLGIKELGRDGGTHSGPR